MYHCVLFKSLTLTSWSWKGALDIVLWGGSRKLFTTQMNMPSGHQEKKNFITHSEYFTSVILLHKSNVHNRTALIGIYKAVVLKIITVECE